MAGSEHPSHFQSFPLLKETPKETEGGVSISVIVATPTTPFELLFLHFKTAEDIGF